MAYEHIQMDPETARSYSRQIYGHEIWLDKVMRDGNTVNVYGLYGHTMVPDKPMPTDYANVLLYDDNGRTEDPDREIIKNPHGWLFSFEDKGADVYTMYVDSNSTWVTNDKGWHRGSKRDYSQVKYSGAFNMVAKRIISRDGVNPGSVLHSTLEIMPERATLQTGKDFTLRVLYEGKPLPNAKVITYAQDDEDFVTYKTDSEGALKYPVRKKAMHVFIAKFTDENKCVSEEFDETSFTTALTMEAE